MPLVNADVKSLEIVVAAELSNDLILKQELRNKVDTHALNQLRFKLPDRVTAKRFIFKILYGASAYGYSIDGDFVDVRFSHRQWQGVIDEFYAKYVGIKAWHIGLIETAQREQRLAIPSGRYYPIRPDYTKKQPWPHTIIKNYPVQGFGADLVMLARCRARQLLNGSGAEHKLCGTIHDSLVVDCPSSEVQSVGQLLKQSVEEVPDLCRSIWGYDFSLPLTAEIKVGKNKKDMTELPLL